jgi:nitrogen fixation/metabolism regulation signal transduction histidine kinase
MYAKKPVPAKIARQAQTMRTNVASMPKLSANAPQTPAIFLLLFESLRGFI